MFRTYITWREKNHESFGNGITDSFDSMKKDHKMSTYYFFLFEIKQCFNETPFFVSTWQYVQFLRQRSIQTQKQRETIYLLNIFRLVLYTLV